MFPFVVDMFPYEVIVSFVVEMYRIVVIALLVVVLPFANTGNCCFQASTVICDLIEKPFLIF